MGLSQIEFFQSCDSPFSVTGDGPVSQKLAAFVTQTRPLSHSGPSPVIRPLSSNYRSRFGSYFSYKVYQHDNCKRYKYESY